MRARDVDTIDQLIPIVIIETKCDLQQGKYLLIFFEETNLIFASDRIVSLEEGQQLAKRYGAPFFSTSARNRINVDEAVFELIRMLRKRRAEKAEPQKKKKNKPAKPVKKVIPHSHIVIPQANANIVVRYKLKFESETFRSYLVIYL